MTENYTFPEEVEKMSCYSHSQCHQNVRKQKDFWKNVVWYRPLGIEETLTLAQILILISIIEQNCSYLLFKTVLMTSFDNQVYPCPGNPRFGSCT